MNSKLQIVNGLLNLMLRQSNVQKVYLMVITILSLKLLLIIRLFYLNQKLLHLNVKSLNYVFMNMHGLKQKVRLVNIQVYVLNVKLLQLKLNMLVMANGHQLKVKLVISNKYVLVVIRRLKLNMLGAMISFVISVKLLTQFNTMLEAI